MKSLSQLCARLLAPALLSLMLPAATAQAQQIILGAGFADFSNGLAEDSAAFAVEYHAEPFYGGNRLNVGWGGSITAHATGDAHIGFGLVSTYDLGNRWFIEGSVMPGAYFERDARNDLGSTFEIRSLLAVGHKLDNGASLSLALTHKSNASTASSNPGVNTLLLRWHRPLQNGGI